MASEEDVGNFLETKKMLLKKACYDATKAHESNKVLFKEKAYDSEVIFSFSGSWGVEDWYSQGPFGETEINGDLFPSLRSIGVDQPSKVNQAFQAKFKSIYDKKELQKRVNLVRDKKQIVFTGHSSGGPIAVLAAIWFLEELRRSNSQLARPPLCITFGSPLVGNHIFSHALRRENWANHFVNFTTRYDIIPRLFLVPFSSIEPNLKQVLEYIGPNPRQGSNRAPSSDSIYFEVLSKVYTVTSRESCQMMESTNQMIETLTSFVELSPYRPFGTYVFCDIDDGKVVWLNNSEAVLQFMFYSWQPESEAEVSTIAQKSLIGPLGYKIALEGVDKWQFKRESSSNEDRTFDVLNHAADSFGLCPKGRLSLLAAGDSEKQKTRNLNKINSKRDDIEKALIDLERYKRACEQRGVGYYDSFKIQDREEDFAANVKRLELVGIWDEVIEMLKFYKLTDNFEGSREWINLGTRFRRLVEPLDVANYYRHLKNEDTGPYMIKGRPKRYRFTQSWLEHFLKVDRGFFGESCFWAEVEELLVRDKIEKTEFERRASELQSNVLRWSKDGVLDQDVFLSKSSFVKLWRSLPYQNMEIQALVPKTE